MSEQGKTPSEAGSGWKLARRVALAFGITVGGANLLGALDVYMYLTYIVPTPIADTASVKRFNLELFVPFLVVTMIVGGAGTRLLLRPVRAWLHSERPASRSEVDRVLRLPLRLSVMSAAIWLFAAIFFAVANLHFSAALAAETGTVIALGGLVTASICYLLSERALRPVTTRALAAGPPDRPALPGVSARMLLAWVFGSGVILIDFVVVGTVVLSGTHASAHRLAVTMIALGGSGIVVGLTVLALAARSVADPVESVRSALAELEKGDLDAEAPVYDASEVGLLQSGFNRMVAGLRERDRLRELFGRQVGEDVARQALERGVELGGEVRDVAVLFIDLVGSTRLAASTDPSSVVATLNDFFAVVVDEVSLHGGWVNKFEGDAALCVFGAPVVHPDAAGAALATGRRLQKRLRRDLPHVEAGVGLSAGPVVAGNVGAAERFEYTVIGDPVNEAARLTELAKQQPGGLLASEEILRRAGSQESPHWELTDTVTLRGRDRATRLAVPIAA